MNRVLSRVCASESLARKPPYARPHRDPASLDADTAAAAALSVWGR